APAARAATQPLAPGPLALRAWRRAAHGDGNLRAPQRVHEVDLDGMLEVLAPCRRRLARAHAAEHLVDEVREAALFVRLATRASAPELEAARAALAGPEREPVAAVRPAPVLAGAVGIEVRL